MSALGSLVVSLNANIAKFESAMNRANYVANRNMQAIAASSRGLQGSIDALPGAIGRVVAAMGAITGLAFAFKKGIDASDEFRVSTIGIAAALTNMSKSGQGDFGQMFDRNLAHAKAMYEEIEKEAAKHFAGPQDMMKAYNQLVQQGYNVRMQEVGALGTLTDKIKLATAGQNQEVQINQEIRALMEGQANAHSAIARELQTRLGTAWKDIVQQHKEAGTLLEYLSSLWPGLGAATKEVQDTLTSQKTTLMGHLAYLGREGLGGAYDDIVGFTKEINAYLKDHGKELAANIVTGWNAVKDVAGGVVAVVSEIVGWLRTGWGLLEGWRSSLSAIAQQRADMGVGLGLDLMPGLEGTGAVANQDAIIATRLKQNQALAKQAEDYKKSTYQAYLKGLGPTQTQAPARQEKGGKGGGGNIEAMQRQLENFIDSMQSAAAKANGETFSVLDSWYSKQARTLSELESKLGESLEGQLALQEAYKSKRDKLIDDWAAKEQKAFLDNAKKIEDSWVNRLQLEQNLFDSLAQTSPILGEQLGFKKKALELEIQIGQATFERKLLELGIKGEQAKQLNNYQELLNQQKRFNAEMENNKGLAGWAFSRNKEVEGKSTIKDLMGGAENFLGNAFSSGIQGVLGKEKSNLKEIGKTMFQGFLGEIHKGSITKSFDALAKMISPIGSKGKGKDDGPKSLSGAGDLLNTAGLQLITSAGGLALSGIGIMTNSQALVMAGTVLQVAGLAIQVYQSLTATTQMTAAAALMGSAAALDAAAMALMMSAATDMIPFFHSGGVITAHAGWPRLKSDEVPIIAQTGERVLSRGQNRDYEAGMWAGGGGQQIIHHNKQEITINGLPTRQEVFKLTRKFRAANDHEARRRG